MKAVSLMSGGIDSTCYTMLKMREGYDIYPLYVDYGQLARIKEWEAVVKICNKLSLRKPSCVVVSTLFDTSALQLFSGNFTSTFNSNIIVPARNALLLVLGSMYAKLVGANVVLYSARVEEAKLFPDCSPSFARLFELAIKEGGVDVEVLSPAIEGIDTKTLLLEAGKINKDVIVNDTWSCYGGGESHCGSCFACVNRAEKLRWLLCQLD